MQSMQVLVTQLESAELKKVPRGLPLILLPQAIVHNAMTNGDMQHVCPHTAAGLLSLDVYFVRLWNLNLNLLESHTCWGQQPRVGEKG